MLPLLLLALVTTTDPPKAPSTRHIRPRSDIARQVVDDAIRRSPTIAHLADEIEASDLIVFIELSFDLPPSAHGRTTLVATAETVRYLNIAVSITLARDRRIEIIGHELTHALEIAHAPEARDGAGLQALFRRVGWSVGTTAFETGAAMSVEPIIREELYAANKHGVRKAA
jgi:hypothetical protein